MAHKPKKLLWCKTCGIQLPLSGWARQATVTIQTLKHRLRNGWDLHRAHQSCHCNGFGYYPARAGKEVFKMACKCNNGREWEAMMRGIHISDLQR